MAPRATPARPRRRARPEVNSLARRSRIPLSVTNRGFMVVERPAPANRFGADDQPPRGLRRSSGTSGRESLAELPSVEHIDALPPLGDRSFAFDLSGSPHLRGARRRSASERGRRFAAYLREPDASPRRCGPRAGGFRGALHRAGARAPKDTTASGSCTRRSGCGSSPTPWRLDRSRASRARVSFARSVFDPRSAPREFLRCSCIHRAQRRLFLHGASIEREGRPTSSSASRLRQVHAGEDETPRARRLGRSHSRPSGPGGTPPRRRQPFPGHIRRGAPVTGLYLSRALQARPGHTDVRGAETARADDGRVVPISPSSTSRRLHPDLFDRLDRALLPVPILFLHSERTDFWPISNAALADDESEGGRGRPCRPRSHQSAPRSFIPRTACCGSASVSAPIDDDFLLSREDGTSRRCLAEVPFSNQDARRAAE